MKKLCFYILLILSLSCKNNNNETLSICFTGDLLLDRGVREQIEKKGPDALFSGVRDLFHTSDAVIANLECPVTNRKTPINKHFIFRGDPVWLPSLKKAGITHLAMANNHTNDQGRDGMQDTYKNIISNSITPIGFGDNHANACNPVIIEKGTIKVAIFNSVQLPLENFPYLPEKPCVCQENSDQLAISISNFKASHPKIFVIVILHWGAEYQTKPAPSQIAGAKKMIDAGADAIIGHHPHVIQTISYFKGKPVFYSLGNFVFDSSKPTTDEGLIVQCNITSQKITFIKHEIKITGCRPVIKNSEILTED